MSPKGTWKDAKKVREFFVSLEPELFIEKPEDWYQVSLKQVRSKIRFLIVSISYERSELEDVSQASEIGTYLHCSLLMPRLYNILCFAFPEVPWNPYKFSRRGKKASQRYRESLSARIHPKVDFFINPWREYSEWGIYFTTTFTQTWHGVQATFITSHQSQIMHGKWSWTSGSLFFS